MFLGVAMTAPAPALGNTSGSCFRHPLGTQPRATDATSVTRVTPGTQPSATTSAHLTQPIDSLSRADSTFGRRFRVHSNNSNGNSCQGQRQRPAWKSWDSSARSTGTTTGSISISSQPGFPSPQPGFASSQPGFASSQPGLSASQPAVLSPFCSMTTPQLGCHLPSTDSRGHSAVTRAATHSARGGSAVTTTAAHSARGGSAVTRAALQDAKGEPAASDSELASQGLRLRSDYQGIDLDQLNSLFGKVGFPRRLKPRLLTALQNTPHLLWLEDTKASQIVGFARATGDGVFNAIIWDVVIDPQLQGQGLGKTLMERMLQVLLAQGICNIGLFAESGVVTFYKPLGFMPDPDGVRCMALRRKAA